MRELELYFHVPFCVRKCLYCDFLSAPADEDTKRKYMEALLAETAGSVSSYGEYQVSSVFIGGGTPSVVPPSSIERLLAEVRKNWRLTQDAEVSIEVNPGTVTEEALVCYRRAGINRLSVGLQSADDEELAMLGRIHTWREFGDTYRAARRAGFANVNVDIMSALPAQTLSRYRETLNRVLALDPPPEHISAYSLTVEEGTYFYEKYQKGTLELPDEETDREMYQMTKERLARSGYRRYEISNYARAGYECRHNCGYWRRKDYLGLGIGAASMVDNVRFRNGEDLRRYLADPPGCKEDIHVLSVPEQMEEFLFLGLRMTAGVSFAEFEGLFGRGMEAVYGSVIHRNIQDGLLRMDSGRLALTDKGLDLSNYVMAQFLL